MKLKFPWKKIQMINACKELADMRLWENYYNLDFFVVETPLEEPVVVSIMGAGGEEYGVSAFRGPDAFEQAVAVIDQKDFAIDRINSIGFSMVYYKDMQYEEKKWFKSCNYRAKKSDWLPSVISKKPGETVEMVEKNHDIDLMSYIVRGIIKAHENGEFCPEIQENGDSKIFTIEVSGDVEEPDVKMGHRSFPGSKELLRLCSDEMIFDDLSELSDIDLSVVPADDDLQGWKLVQKALTIQFINFWHESDYLRKSRPAKKFFGDDDWEYYIEEYNDVAALPTYVTWAALTYRQSKNKPTYAEKLLADDIPESLRISLESLNNSYPSLYQVTEIDEETGCLVLRDLLLSKTITVHDQGLSETARLGWIVPFWVHSTGKFNFVDIAGPIFGALNSTEVMDELLELKLPAETTPGWLRENAYIFGRLWDLYDEIMASDPVLPNLTNTDGQPLEFIKACFECGDLKKVRKALLQRNDIDYDDNTDEYIWFKDNPDDSVMGNTLLARIFFQDGKIEAETNSAGRLDSLIDMLEDIDGVRYLEHESKDIETMVTEAPESERDIVEEDLPEEVIAAVQGRMTRYYMDWLDKPNSALGNKTPRQAAKNKKTAQKTRILIETIPAPASSNDIKIPKQEMLRSIGFDEN